MANPILQLPNAFNVGQDFSATISDGLFTRNLDEFGQLEMFRARALTKKIEVAPISRGGKHLYRTLYAGAEVHVRWARVFAAMQYLWTALQNNYFNQHQFTSFIIAASVINRDGTVDQHLFTGCEIDDPDFGDFEGAKQVNNEMNLRCQQYQVISPNAPPPGGSPLAFT
jgi:hypothetical protein